HRKQGDQAGARGHWSGAHRRSADREMAAPDRRGSARFALVAAWRAGSAAFVVKVRAWLTLNPTCGIASRSAVATAAISVRRQKTEDRSRKSEDTCPASGFLDFRFVRPR